MSVFIKEDQVSLSPDMVEKKIFLNPEQKKT